MGIAIHSAFVEDAASLEKIFLVTSMEQQNYFAHSEYLWKNVIYTCGTGGKRLTLNLEFASLRVDACSSQLLLRSLEPGICQASGWKLVTSVSSTCFNVFS